jgi:hypothetical protein
MSDGPDCPWCEAEIDMVLGFDNLGDTFPCPHCGKPCEVEGDYASEESWYFALIQGTPDQQE